MNQSIYQPPHSSGEPSSQFQTINVKPKIKVARQATSWVKNMLEGIHRLHVFTVLLILILGWSGYNVLMRSSEPHAVIIKSSIKKLSALTKEAFHIDPNKKVASLAKQHRLKKNLPTKHPADLVLPSEEPPMIVEEVISMPSPTPQQLPAEALIEEKKIKQLEKTLEKVQSSLEHANAEMERMEQRINQLNEKLAHWERAQAQTQSKPSDRPSEEPPVPQNNESIPEKLSNKVKPPSNAASYSLHAVLPGRAWLNTPDGKIVTVSIGNYIPDYGIIQSIDAKRGIVYSNTGAMIQFSASDD